MPARTHGQRGNFLINRMLPVGLLKRSSGTSDLHEFRDIQAEINRRVRLKDWETLEALCDGRMRCIDLVDNTPRRPLRRPRKLMLYFIRRADLPEIKIGVSRDVAARLRGLQTAHALPLVLLATAPACPWDEKEIHKRFAACRKGQEWFAETPELLAFIEKVQAAGGLE